MGHAMKYIITGVLAGAYLRSDDRRAYLTHAVVDGADPNAVWQALCGRVKPESLNDDSCAPGYLENTGAPTCKACARKLAKLIQAAESSGG